MLGVKYQKPTIEARFLDLINKHKDKNLAFILVFYFLLINWSTVKDIKDTANLIAKNKIFTTNDPPEAFSDRCNIISRGPNLLL